jgi:RimJ/RimL family protein N-acetyltransferase
LHEAGGLSLAPFAEQHLSRTLTWTNDPELARLLGRARRVTDEEHQEWFRSQSHRFDTIFFAIEVGPAQTHIGNVWLADIDRRHLKAEVRIVIGAPAPAGSGSRAIDLIATHAFEAMGLHRLYAYVLAFNPRARRTFEKSGFVLEGTLRDDRFDGTAFVDAFLLGRVASR